MENKLTIEECTIILGVVILASVVSSLNIKYILK